MVKGESRIFLLGAESVIKIYIFLVNTYKYLLKLHNIFNK